MGSRTQISKWTASRVSSPERSASRLRLPGFGRELLEVRERGQVPVRGFANCHVIVALDSWDLARDRWRLVIAREDDPLGLDFLGIAGLDVLLAVNSGTTDLARRNDAARAILRSRPASLIELDVRAPHALRFIKTRKVGIELKEFL
jgi:hypothetical protein